MLGNRMINLSGCENNFLPGWNKGLLKKNVISTGQGNASLSQVVIYIATGHHFYLGAHMLS
jgi:hypothetical protein